MAFSNFLFQGCWRPAYYAARATEANCSTLSFAVIFSNTDQSICWLALLYDFLSLPCRIYFVPKTDYFLEPPFGLEPNPARYKGAMLSHLTL